MRDLLLECVVCSLQTVAEQYLVLCWSGSLGSELRVPVSVKISQNISLRPGRTPQTMISMFWSIIRSQYKRIQAEAQQDTI